MIKIPDPLQTLERVFNELYPDIECKMVFVIDLFKDVGAYGQIFYPDEGKKVLPFIQIDVETPFKNFIEVLAHELAHLATGYIDDDGHTEDWEIIFDRLLAETEKRYFEEYHFEHEEEK